MTVTMVTGGKINGTINIVRSTKGCLTCNLLAWGCQNLTTYNVTVIIVTWKLLSVGERQLPFCFMGNGCARCKNVFFVKGGLAFFSRGGVIYILSGVNYENTA